ARPRVPLAPPLRRRRAPGSCRRLGLRIGHPRRAPPARRAARRPTADDRSRRARRAAGAGVRPRSRRRGSQQPGFRVRSRSRASHPHRRRGEVRRRAPARTGRRALRRGHQPPPCPRRRGRRADLRRRERSLAVGDRHPGRRAAHLPHAPEARARAPPLPSGRALRDRAGPGEGAPLGDVHGHQRARRAAWPRPPARAAAFPDGAPAQRGGRRPRDPSRARRRRGPPAAPRPAAAPRGL
ncbi:MAG: hypothetical protein AVDCRST_MAG53-2254, partial [uncultured Solirubrobacteraceae bacterium]